MKKLATILLLALFVFNLAGYRLLLDYLQQRSSIRLESSLDRNQYNEEDLITIRVPLSLPYLNNWKEFERTNGKVTLNGKVYKYVKRRVYNGELILMCLPDRENMQLETAKNDFFKIANDITQNTNSKKQDNTKNIIKYSVSDYDQHSLIYLPVRITCTANYTNYYPYQLLVTAPHISPEQPPESI